MIRDNISLVKKRIVSAAKRAGRDPDGITLVCVTKDRSFDDIKEAIDSGVRDIGENRVQEAALKYKDLAGKIKLHFIGHLQTNKVKDALSMFDLIHSVDSYRLACAIDREAEKIGKRADILIQVNVSGESTKFGVDPDEVPGLLKQSAGLKNVMVLGLMTIAPLADKEEKARPCFKRLREIFDYNRAIRSGNIDMRYMSMGMSGDFEAAVEEGANILRIGSAIFGPRS